MISDILLFATISTTRLLHIIVVYGSHSTIKTKFGMMAAVANSPKRNQLNVSTKEATEIKESVLL